MAEKDVEVVKSKKDLYEEKKQERLAKREREAKLQEKKQAQAYRNPIKTVWGQVIIWILCLAMVASIVFSFIFLLIKAFK